MKSISTFIILLCIGLMSVSCVSKKQLLSVQSELDIANEELGRCGESLNSYMNQLATCKQEKESLLGRINNDQNTLDFRTEQIDDLKKQIDDLRSQRDQTQAQVTELTVLTREANENINKTLSQLESKDKYLQLLAAARTKTDSINLALAVNLQSVLKEGIEDRDIDVKVDKTVVFINLSDKMLYQSGSSRLSSRAKEVLGKIAQIINARREFEVMVEGYTDNVPIRTSCFEDNWDLSVKRATSVVRSLQKDFNIDPNRLIAAGRGEYNVLASNETAEGRSTNRRTRIIILPKLDEFYELLNPNNVPAADGE